MGGMDVAGFRSGHRMDGIEETMALGGGSGTAAIALTVVMVMVHVKGRQNIGTHGLLLWLKSCRKKARAGVRQL